MVPPPNSGDVRGLSGNSNLGQEITLDDHELARRLILSGENAQSMMVSDRYRLLRTRLRQVMEPREWNSVGVTSPSSKEGKSLTSINLSIVASRETSGPVVLIDADIRRPSIASYLGFEPKAGLVDYFRDDAGLEDIVFRPTNFPNLSVVAAGNPGDSPEIVETLGSQKMDAVIKQLGAQASLVVVDLPPALVADDVLSVAPQLDSLLLVVRDGETDLGHLKKTRELLDDFNIIGTVLNASDEDSADQHNYYYDPARS